MLALALRYLLVAVVVGAGFAMLQGNEWLERTAATSAAGPSRALHAAAASPRADGDGWEYVVEAGAHGHFVLDAVVDGVPLTFLVDTGASDIVLTLDDARELGFRPQELEFSQRFRTANGEVRGAPVRLRELRIGQFSLYDLEASVNEAPLAISLLGMGFLEQLAGYEVDDGRLILRW
ncbi:MAG: family clan aspartic protease [Geminicoccaceae bacterium]|jgi:aspartyl protease family protein|nr:family clan aspartic protease [Geminicoccaceae bacterium]